MPMNPSLPRLRSRVTVASGPLPQRRSTWPAEAIASTRDAADHGHSTAQMESSIAESFSDCQAYYPNHVAGVVRRGDGVRMLSELRRWLPRLCVMGLVMLACRSGPEREPISRALANAKPSL